MWHAQSFNEEGHKAAGAEALAEEEQDLIDEQKAPIAVSTTSLVYTPQAPAGNPQNVHMAVVSTGVGQGSGASSVAAAVSGVGAAPRPAVTSVTFQVVQGFTPIKAGTNGAL